MNCFQLIVAVEDDSVNCTARQPDGWNDLFFFVADTQAAKLTNGAWERQQANQTIGQMNCNWGNKKKIWRISIKRCFFVSFCSRRETKTRAHSASAEAMQKPLHTSKGSAVELGERKQRLHCIHEIKFNLAKQLEISSKSSGKKSQAHSTKWATSTVLENPKHVVSIPRDKISKVKTAPHITMLIFQC